LLLLHISWIDYRPRCIVETRTLSGCKQWPPVVALRLHGRHEDGMVTRIRRVSGSTLIRLFIVLQHCKAASPFDVPDIPLQNGGSLAQLVRIVNLCESSPSLHGSAAGGRGPVRGLALIAVLLPWVAPAVAQPFRVEIEMSSSSTAASRAARC
jgi:hypothetical protein